MKNTIHTPFTSPEYEYASKGYEHTGQQDLNKTHAEICDGTTKHPDMVVDGDVTVLFHNQQDVLLRLIENSHTIVGCVAWLTDLNILKALRGKTVCIIVQKEDFLRPDLDSGMPRDFRRKLHDAYASLKGINRLSLQTPFNTCGEDDQEPAILCAGLANLSKKPAWPRMHHKFLLFRRTPHTEPDNCYPQVSPFDAVFTGSYNITKNAENSLENSLIIQRPSIVDAYYREFEHIFGISEPLDWNSEWVNPRYRVGT